MSAIKPSALLLTSSQCPHCHSLEQLLTQRQSSGQLGELDVVNIEKSPEIAQQLGIRSVPWLRLGVLEFDSAPTSDELDDWLNLSGQAALSAYLGYLLQNGKLQNVLEWIEQDKAGLSDLLPLLVDPEVKLNVRIGIGAVMESFEGHDQLKALYNNLVQFCQHKDPVVRIDACHYLALSHLPQALGVINKMLNDEHEHVREVAAESIELLESIE